MVLPALQSQKLIRVWKARYALYDYNLPLNYTTDTDYIDHLIGTQMNISLAFLIKWHVKPTFDRYRNGSNVGFNL